MSSTLPIGTTRKFHSLQPMGILRATLEYSIKPDFLIREFLDCLNRRTICLVLLDTFAVIAKDLSAATIAVVRQSSFLRFSKHHAMVILVL
jgi:hypothetical protein